MSCITEILNKKGEQPFMLVPSQTKADRGGGIIIEGGGTYNGYEYLITFQDMGFRCGYVAISEKHPIYNTDDSYHEGLYVHGGVTFFGESHLAKPILGHSCTDKWVGFDAGHCYDTHDIDTVRKYFPNLNEHAIRHVAEMNEICRRDPDCAIRTFDYMEEQCKQLIDQLIEKEAA